MHDNRYLNMDKRKFIHLSSISFFPYLTYILVHFITKEYSSYCHILVYTLALFHGSLFLTVHLSHHSTLPGSDPVTSCLGEFDFIPTPVPTNIIVLLG